MEVRAKAKFAPVVALLLLGLLVPSYTSAADWKERQLPFTPRYEGDLEGGPLLGISCPTKSFCVTGGQYGRIAASSNPTGSASEWNVFYVPEGSDTPPPPPGLPTPPPPPPNVKGVSCPSPTLCIAVSGNGDIYSSSNPTGGTLAWLRADIDGDDYDTHLEGVSCPTVSFCVAVSGGIKQNNNPPTSGKVLWSTNPAGGSAAWQVTQLDPTFDLRGVSCASPSLCVAVGQNGRIVVSTNPTGGPSAWRDVGTPGGPVHSRGIACVSGPLCIAGNAGGNLLTTTDPAGNPTGWAERNGGGSVPITGISCPSALRCIAVDNNGDVLTSHDPTGGPGAWSFENVLPYVPPTETQPPYNGMFGVSCPSTLFCAIAAADGKILTSVNPFDSASSTASQGKRVRAPKRPRTILAHVDRRRTRTRTNWLRVRFRFYAKGKVRRFICKRDRLPYRSCRSPVTYRADLGRHVFRVRAIGITGLKGPVALDRFTVVPVRNGKSSR